MARTGLYKSEVKKARDAMLAQGRHPSVDAVRVALGNTGSKTTIHKYLKELDEEEGRADGRKASISESLQDFVARLAEQLQTEANAQIDVLRLEQAENERQHVAILAAAHQEIQQLREDLQRMGAARHQEQDVHDKTRAALQQETIVHHTLEQQVADLKERLAENESHRQSLEEKHLHARDALEHYRQSVREQRDADQRRHEQQIQQLQAELRQAQQTVILKQEDVTRLNQEGVRLIADLSHAQKAVLDEQEQGRRLSYKLETAQIAEQRCSTLEAQAAERDARIVELKQQLIAASASAEEVKAQLQAAQLDAASAKGALEAQQSLLAGLRSAGKVGA
jgi:hypothetical protein